MLLCFEPGGTRVGISARKISGWGSFLAHTQNILFITKKKLVPLPINEKNHCRILVKRNMSKSFRIAVEFYVCFLISAIAEAGVRLLLSRNPPNRMFFRTNII